MAAVKTRADLVGEYTRQMLEAEGEVEVKATLVTFAREVVDSFLGTDVPVKVLNYAKQVLVENSATPNANIAIVARECMRQAERCERFKTLLGAIDQTLLRTRSDVRRILDE